MILNKILFLLHTPPPVHGSSIIGSFIKDSEVVNSNFESDYINLSTSQTINEIGQFSFIKIFKILNIYKNVISFNFKKKYDLCYIGLRINGKAFYIDLLIVLLLKLLRKKIVLHLHNKGVSRFTNISRRIGYKIVFNKTKVILLSKLLYHDIEKYVSENQILICPNGIKEKMLTKKIEDKHKCIINILFLSNMMRAKGVYILLKACKVLKEKKLKFICNFVGGWKDISEHEFKSYVSRFGLESYVRCHGPKYNDDKEIYFNEADIFVHPTLEDCFPLNLLEALNYSLPIIASYEGGIPDIVNDNSNGLLIEKNNVKMLVEKLKLLIEDGETRIKFGDEGSKLFNTNFTKQKFENRLIEVLKEAIYG